MAWLITTDEVPEAWPLRCVGCGAAEPSGRLKAYGERLKASVGVAHIFERLCVELPWCERCAARATAMVFAGVGLIVVPWVLLLALSFEPSVAHLVEPQVLVTACCVLNGVGMLLLGARYWFTRPVRLLASKEGVTGFVLRNREVARELADLNGLSVDRCLRPRGW